MTDTIIQIMMEVLNILGMAMKESRMSKYMLYKCDAADGTMFREMCDRSKLIGKRDVENALKRLDKLTHEEARVMTAQNLKTVHTVGDSVGPVDDLVAIVDDRVLVIDDKVAEAISGT